MINNFLKEVNFTDPDYLFIKDEIQNLINNENLTVHDLTDKLLVRLGNNEKAKQLVIDMLFSLDDKKYLDEKLLQQYISENIICINQYVTSLEQRPTKVKLPNCK